jgi:hypothetical protein
MFEEGTHNARPPDYTGGRLLMPPPVLATSYTGAPLDPIPWYKVYVASAAGRAGEWR